MGETQPGAPNPLCAAGTGRRRRSRCNLARGGLQAWDPAAAYKPSVRLERPPFGIRLRRDGAAGFPRRSVRPGPSATGRAAPRQLGSELAIAAQGRPRDKGPPAAGGRRGRLAARSPPRARSAPCPGPADRVPGPQPSSPPAWPGPGSGVPEVPGRGNPARLPAPAPPPEQSRQLRSPREGRRLPRRTG